MLLVLQNQGLCPAPNYPSRATNELQPFLNVGAEKNKFYLVSIKIECFKYRVFGTFWSRNFSILLPRAEEQIILETKHQQSW